jgi:hypothetical protein
VHPRNNHTEGCQGNTDQQRDEKHEPTLCIRRRVAGFGRGFLRRLDPESVGADVISRLIDTRRGLGCHATGGTG